MSYLGVAAVERGYRGKYQGNAKFKFKVAVKFLVS